MDEIYLVMAIDKWGNIIAYDTADGSNVIDKIDRIEANIGEYTIAVKLDQLKELIKTLINT